MKHPRIQPYLAPELTEKLRAYAAARSLTVSAVMTAALTEYFERDAVEDELIVRRLDGVTHAISQLQRDLDTLAVGFGRFVRYSFYTAPEGVTARVVERAEGLYAEFLAKVCEQLRDGVRFTGQVWRPRGRPGRTLPSGAVANGGREGEGRGQ